MKQLVIFPTGSLTAKDKERMSKEGYIAIECENPHLVKMPIPFSDGAFITGSMMLEAAISGLNMANSGMNQNQAWKRLMELVSIKLKSEKEGA